MERTMCKEVQEAINKRFDGIYVRDGQMTKPYVCIVCDEFVTPRKRQRLSKKMLSKNAELLKPNEWNKIPKKLAKCYRYCGNENKNEDLNIDGTQFKIKQLLLSPRASYNEASGGFSCCQPCKNSLSRGLMPSMAIANNYCFGSPPACLTILSEVELALLTPIKTYGYCFSYTGGRQKQLKGSLSYYKVDVGSVARAAMHFDVLGLNNNVVILLYGKMTCAQQMRARERCMIRTNYILKALKWLTTFNEEWIRRKIDLDEIKQKLMNPVIVNNSQTEDGGNDLNNNIESTESFQVFFPDGTMSAVNGGQENIERFNELLKVASTNGYDIAFKSNLMKEAVPDYKDNNLVNACLLQFPYGRGGMQEVRLNSNGSFTSSTDIEEFLQHVSNISQPHFHQELFCLIVYNLSMKQGMLRTARWKVRNKCDAKELAQELTMEDVSAAISTRVLSEGRKRKKGDRGEKVLDAVDAIAKAVPHTNEAARQARATGECIQHHFGTPSIFLTVTPDDENSYIVQVLANQTVGIDVETTAMTDAKLILNARERVNLRISFPGICALFFEYVLDIILEEVVGWDLEKGKSREDKPGLFGVAQAFTATVEEQGRRTLHTHIQVWLKQFNEVREALHSQERHVERSAIREICQFVDDVSSSALFCFDTGNEKKCEVAKAFPHDCSVSRKSHRRIPVIVDDQCLRNLRQKKGTSDNDEVLAYCPECYTGWSSDELVESYLIHGQNILGMTSFPDTDVRRLKSMAIDYQRDAIEDESVLPCVVNAAYNHHSHTRSCFEKYDEVGEERHCGKDKNKKPEECRYRYPQRMHRETIIQNASAAVVSWYAWDGSKTDRFIKEVCPRRGKYDVFQNICCPAISHSKLTCNTNITVVMPGPVGQYSFKYNLKGTQKEDTKEYSAVKEAMQKVLSKLRTYNCEKSEAVKRVLAASFAHQRTNVVGAAMASFLTRKKSRFLFSHKVVWCPLRDMQSLLQGGQASVSLTQNNNNVPFFQCAALHYLCRPIELEEVNAFDFYSKYEAVQATWRNRLSLLKFTNDFVFHHPSYRTRSGIFLQGVRKRETPQLVKVFQYEFPDTAEFNGSFLDDEVVITKSMEHYSMLLLLLFVPFRELSDIVLDDSFTKFLREVYRTGHIGETAISFMQNMLDTRANSFRVSRLEDDLQRRTKLMKLSENDDDDESVTEIQEEMEGVTLDEMLYFLEMEGNSNSDCTNDVTSTPGEVNLAPLRNKGSEKCGYNCLSGMRVGEMDNLKSLLHIEEKVNENMDDQDENNGEEDSVASVTNPSQHNVVTVLLSKTSRRQMSFQEITKNEEVVSLLEANGSVRSIIDWAVKAKLDREQRRCFEIIMGTFILTFYGKTTTNEQLIFGDRHYFVMERKRLKTLTEVRKRGSEQLILFLHGPGGSGKTTVIDLVLKYAEEFCSYLENFRFGPRTILVTAMTGVAATLLLGETTHRAVYLNQRKPIEAYQIEEWIETRLLIIDEISFASKSDFVNLHKKVRRLKQNLNLHYGGLSIVFSGDMRQLEPVGANKKPIYEDNCPEFKDWVNCFIELVGMHRFKDDIEWGKLLLRFRNGTMTMDDVKKVNERVVKKGMKIPDDIKYATYFNRDRDAINTALFEERCKQLYLRDGDVKDSLLVFSDNLLVQNGNKKYVSFKNCQSFWENCGEDSVKPQQGKGRMDPLLKLYEGSRVMLTANRDVRGGKANGTQATVEKVVLKHGNEPKTVLVAENIPVDAVNASQVSYMVLQHSNERIKPPLFIVKPEQHVVKAKILKPHTLQVKGKERETLHMKVTQLPVVINNATTGHKLQGSGVAELFVHNWSYVTNWVYVMLSRVKTHSGLYCRKPISSDLSKYVVPESLKKMMLSFSDRCPSYWTEEDYKDMFGI